MDLLQIVMTCNTFEWDGKLYSQKLGTVMGTMVAPTYACLFMAWLETQKILKLWTGTKPIMYKHFIDDIFFIWPGSHLELKSFLKHMNQ